MYNESAEATGISGMSSEQIDRRYQVFISSTFRDLKKQRKAAIEGVINRGHIPIALEGFSPSNASDLEVIKKAMADCQVFLLILGHRYGDFVPGDEISFTEYEYNLAQDAGLHTLTFVMKENDLEKRRKKLDAENTRDAKELENFGKLKNFHARTREHSRKYWTPADGNAAFRADVELALSDDLGECQYRGFIREPDDLAMVESSENEFIVDIVGELRGFQKLYARCSKKSAEKRQLARFFTEQYLDRIVSHKVSLYFESGSTVAYVAKEIARSLAGKVTIDDGSPSIRISGNNVLAYLLLWLQYRIPCTLFPWSPPEEETYGAVYGGLEKRLVDRSPDYRMPTLDESALKEIERLHRADASISKMPRPALLLGATSGLQMGSDPDLKFPIDLHESRKKSVTSEVSQCLGPHVGSYHNMVYKRFMYSTELPIVIFLTGDKIDSAIEVGRCHFILDSEYTWAEFCQSHPVAFCVACDVDKLDKYASQFETLGFDVIKQDATEMIAAFIARNKAFIKAFERATQISSE